MIIVSNKDPRLCCVTSLDTLITKALKSLNTWKTSQLHITTGLALIKWRTYETFSRFEHFLCIIITTLPLQSRGRLCEQRVTKCCFLKSPLNLPCWKTRCCSVYLLCCLSLCLLVMNWLRAQRLALMLPVVFLFSAGWKQATHECSQSLYYRRLNIHAASCVSKVSTGCLHSNDNDMANIESCSQTDVYEGKCKNTILFRRISDASIP